MRHRIGNPARVSWRPARLTRYRETILKAAEHRVVDPCDEVTSWRLLTLLPPAFSPPEPWEVVTYEDLIEPLEQTAASLEGDTAALVRGYACLVARLVRLTSLVDIGENLDVPVQLDPDLASMLREFRLLALVSASCRPCGMPRSSMRDSRLADPAHRVWVLGSPVVRFWSNASRPNDAAVSSVGRSRTARRVSR